MYKVLDNYLKEISHYLWECNNSEEVIKEIESHILEKVEDKFGKVEEEGIEIVIKEYGNPKNVASKYLEGKNVIEPSFKNYLFLYTGILYAIHSGLYLVSLIFERDILVAPFIYIGKVNYYNIIFSILAAFIFDFGLVCLYLFLVTRKHLESNLRWFSEFKCRKKSTSIISLVFSILIFVIAFYYTMKLGSMFIVINHNEKINLISDTSLSKQYSLFILLAVGILIMYEFIDLLANTKLPQIGLLFLELFTLSLISKLPIDLFINLNIETNLKNNMVKGIKILFVLFVIKIILDLVKRIINFTIQKVMKYQVKF